MAGDANSGPVEVTPTAPEVEHVVAGSAGEGRSSLRFLDLLGAVRDVRR